MQSGMNIALITDEGTPGISETGEELAAMSYDAGIEVTSLPGPAACITALTLSGLSTRRFAFEAFLPMDKKERWEMLREHLVWLSGKDVAVAMKILPLFFRIN